VKHPRVSVVVPIYNVEPYLKKCVDSLLSQTLEDIEILLVDDGVLTVVVRLLTSMLLVSIE
jgi:glycosyltransferase involved in cell wall biosynthesis